MANFKSTLTGKQVEEYLKQVVELPDKINEVGLSTFKGIYVDYNHLVNVGSVYEYVKNSSWDCAWLNIPNNAKKINIVGQNSATRFIFFKSYNIVDEECVGNNKTGEIIDGAILCIINFKKDENTEGYDKLGIVFDYEYGFLKKQTYYDTMGEYIRNVPIGKNMIDPNPDSLLYGYIISSGKLVENASGIMSGKIYLEKGKTYTMQGIVYYGTEGKIFVGFFDKKDNYISRVGYAASYTDGSKYGTATFTFNEDNNEIAYARIVLQTSKNTPFDPNIAQLEEGNAATSFVKYTGRDKFIIDTNKETSDKDEKELKILCYGNSYTQDCMSYLPFILKNIAPDVKQTIAIAYFSGCTLQQHYVNATGIPIGSISAQNYIYYKYRNGSSRWEDGVSKNFDSCLSDEKWDIVMLQQGSSQSWLSYESTFKPYAEPLIKAINDKLTHNVKLGLIMNHSSRTEDSAELLSRWQALKSNYQKMMDTLPFEFIIPYATAIQNARTCADIANVYGTSSMQADSNGHLSDGLPCLIADYCAVLSMLEIIGMKYISIFKESTRPNYSWCTTRNIMGMHKIDTTFSVSDRMAYLAQFAAIAAFKKPYEITDMSELSL